MDLSGKTYSPSQSLLHSTPLRASSMNAVDHSQALALTGPTYTSSPSSYTDSPSSYRPDAFPYGLSGVAMPNYGYVPSDIYQFTTNGYPRKSRTCSYCGKVFTRSTTRRYHEKRCPLLRAAVSSFIGEGGSQALDQASKMTDGQSKALSEHEQVLLSRAMSATPRMSNSRIELATSQLLTPPLALDNKRSDGDMYSGYTSVIVKPEPQELQNQDTSVSALADSRIQELHSITTSVSSLTPESMGGSPHKPQPEESSFSTEHSFQGSTSLTRSPAHLVSDRTLQHSTSLFQGQTLINNSAMKDSGRHGINMGLEFPGPDALRDTLHDGPMSLVVNRFALDPGRDKQYHLDVFGQDRVSENRIRQEFSGENRVRQEFVKDSLVQEEFTNDSRARHEYVNESQLGFGFMRPPTSKPATSATESSTSDVPPSTVVALQEDFTVNTLSNPSGETLPNSIDLYLPNGHGGSVKPFAMRPERRDRERPLGNCRCGICGKLFDNARQLHAHEQLHTKFKPYACRSCGLRFAKATLRMAHERVHSRENSHVCAVCGSSFTRKYSLRLHVRRRHHEGPWLCRHCGSALMTQTELKHHLLSHNLPKCERESLKYIPDVPLHGLSLGMLGFNIGLKGTNHCSDTNSDNLDQNIFAAAANSDAANNEQTMIGSSGVMDENETKETCRECGKEFLKSYMRYHTKVHESQKPYGCPICGKRFGYKNNMKSHIRLHAGVKPYSCNVCGARFTRGSTLRRHARRHGIMADSVWDLFISNNFPAPGSTEVTASTSGSSSAAVSNIQANTSGSNCNSVAPPISSLETTGVKLGHNDLPLATDSVYSSYFAPRSFSPCLSTSGTMFINPYGPRQIALPPAIYSPIPSTSPLSNTSGFRHSSQSPQSQNDVALNLSMHKSTDPPSLTHASLTHLSMSGRRSRTPSGSMSGRRSPSISDRSGKRSLSPTASERSSLYESEINKNISSQLKFSCRDIGVQVHTCCQTGELTLDGFATSTRNPYDFIKPDSHGAMSTSSRDGAWTPGSGDSLDVGIMTESLSSLLSTGRLFRCKHCECFFSEYAMYRIHAKLHVRADPIRPFVCPTCGEDCHDRVYFALHISEHMR